MIDHSSGAGFVCDAATSRVEHHQQSLLAVLDKRGDRVRRLASLMANVGQHALCDIFGDHAAIVCRRRLGRQRLLVTSFGICSRLCASQRAVTLTTLETAGAATRAA